MNRVLELRKNLHMTQDAFSEFCDVSRVSIARYEAGGPIKMDNAWKIASACNVSIDYVLNRPPEPLLPEPQATPALSLSDEEYDLIIDYRKMSRKGQNRTRELVDEMLTLYPSRL